MSPEELNETTNDVVEQLIDVVLDHPQGREAGRFALAPFITLQLLHRVNLSTVARIKARRCNLSKHLVLAMAVLEATGVPQPPDLRDVESIGNRLDIFVKRKFVMEEKRISKNYKGKAKEARRRTVAIQCCIVSKTGQIELCSATEIQNATTARLAVNRKAPHLPYTRDTLPAAKSAAELAYELSAAKERIRSAQMLAERAEQAMAAKVAEEFRVRSVKQRGVEMLAAQRTAYEDSLLIFIH